MSNPLAISRFLNAAPLTWAADTNPESLFAGMIVEDLPPLRIVGVMAVVIISIIHIA